MTASVVALAAAPPRAAAQEECGPTAATVTCPVDTVGPDYPNGITYAPAADFTLNFDDAVAVNGTAGVTVTNSAGNGAVNAPNVTITSPASGIEMVNSGDGDASISAGGAITAVTNGLHASTAGAGAASAALTSGTITMNGAGAAGVRADAAGAGAASASADGDITVTGDGGFGLVATGVDGAALATSTGAITIEGATGVGASATSTAADATASVADVAITGDTGIGAQATSTDGAASATSTGTITVTGATPIGIQAQNLGAGTATATGNAVTVEGDNAIGVRALTLDGDATATANGAVSATGLAAEGVHAESTGAGDAIANAMSDVTVSGDDSFGVRALSVDGAALVGTAGAISVTGTTAVNGITAMATGADADATVTGTGSVTVDGGPASTGIVAQSSGAGAASITYDGDVSVAGEESAGVYAVAAGGAGDVTLDLNGNVSAPGELSNAVSADTDGAITATLDGSMQGGWTSAPDPFVATGVTLRGGASVALTNNATIGSMSDSALTVFSPLATVDNNGTITGFMTFDDGDLTFNNNSATSFDIRNFADTDGDGVRDTEAVAISDFGGGDDVFNNTAAGSVVLLNVAGATTIDTTGALLPEIGDPAGYDITLEGVEQGQLTNLETFNNAGAIIMQDALAGGAGPVAGDVLVITGGEAGPANFVSDGGTLALDTVLNEGGAAASLSDVLMLDMTTLGTGATALSIANAGGAGAQTIEDGIMVVDVADPAASAAGAFALDDFVIAGAYQYQLYQGGDAATGGDPADGNWYLRSNISPTTDIYRAYPSTLMRFSRTAIGTLQQRLGNRWWRVPEQQVERTVTDPAPPPPPAQTREFVVFFDWDKYNIREDAQATINEAAEYAKSGNAARIVVVGHTDTSGPEDYNMALSERRARAVSDALQAQGVAAQVIGMEWLGETRPAIDTGDGIREERNRRAYIQVDVPGMAAGPAQPRTRTVMETIPASTEIQGSGVWGRIVGADGEYNRDDDAGSVDEDLWMAQAGVDFLVHEDEQSRLIAGVSIHYGEISSDVSNSALGELASIDSTGTGASVSLTYYNENGVYVDGVLSGTWYDTDIDSGLFGPLSSNNDATAWAISVEGGKRIPFSAESDYYWVPQGQLIYTSSDVDTFTDPFGATVEDSDSDSLVGRLGVAVEYLNRTTGDDGSVRRMQGYGIFSVLYEFLGMPGASVAGLDFDEDFNDFWGEFGAGFTYSFNEQWSVYGEGLYRTAFEDFGDSYNLQGSVGVRYNW